MWWAPLKTRMPRRTATRAVCRSCRRPPGPCASPPRWSHCQSAGPLRCLRHHARLVPLWGRLEATPRRLQPLPLWRVQSALQLAGQPRCCRPSWRPGLPHVACCSGLAVRGAWSPCCSCWGFSASSWHALSICLGRRRIGQTSRLTLWISDRTGAAQARAPTPAGAVAPYGAPASARAATRASGGPEAPSWARPGGLCHRALLCRLRGCSARPGPIPRRVAVPTDHGQRQVTKTRSAGSSRTEPDTQFLACTHTHTDNRALHMWSLQRIDSYAASAVCAAVKFNA